MKATYEYDSISNQLLHRRIRQEGGAAPAPTGPYARLTQELAQPAIFLQLTPIKPDTDIARQFIAMLNQPRIQRMPDMGQHR